LYRRLELYRLKSNAEQCRSEASPSPPTQQTEGPALCFPSPPFCGGEGMEGCTSAFCSDAGEGVLQPVAISLWDGAEPPQCGHLRQRPLSSPGARGLPRMACAIRASGPCPCRCAAARSRNRSIWEPCSPQCASA